MRVVVDGMGGDKAPDAVLKGVALALRSNHELECIITGPKEYLEHRLYTLGRLIYRFNIIKERISIVDAPETVEMGEKPIEAVKRKVRSSIAVGLKLIKDGEAFGFVSAGNTGAVMAHALFTLGRLPGVRRPALAVFIPTERDPCLVLDVGANVGSQALDLCQFGVMGSLYVEKVYGVRTPRVALLNIGAEQGKGSKLTKDAYALLQKAPVNFVGNIEGDAVFDGKADVVVCEGFVGNTLLKFGEGLVNLVMNTLKGEITRSWRAKLGAVFMLPSFMVLKRRLHYEEYGGAILLGVNGVAVVSHGKSGPVAIKNAIMATARFIKERVNEAILYGLKQMEEEASE